MLAASARRLRGAVPGLVQVREAERMGRAQQQQRVERVSLRPRPRHTTPALPLKNAPHPLLQAAAGYASPFSAAAALRPAAATHPAWLTAAADAAAAPPPPEDAGKASPPPPPGGRSPPTPAQGMPHATDHTTAASSLTPRAVVEHLDRHIVGQDAAKRAVANALRTRWRRHRVSPATLRGDILPKNILMVGPTGCGKTEVARRLAKLAAAPFIKVEATKFTEVGFHGRDVDQIVRDLVEAAIGLAREQARARARAAVAAAVEARLLAALCGDAAGAATLDTFRTLYRTGALDDRRVVLDLPVGLGNGRGPSSPSSSSLPADLALDSPGVPASMAEVIARVDRLVSGGRGGGGGQGGGGARMERRDLTIGEARPLVEEAEADRLVSQEDVIRAAIAATESDGIVFIDEVDKIVVSSDQARYGADASSTGVQRDLLPLLDGCVIPTKHGPVNTEHILFIASGAFHTCKPSDMLAELQGRLPIRVELKGLNAADFYRILTEPESNLLTQHAALLATEGVDLSFTDCAIREVARIAEEVNTAGDNIGARRLHTVLERVLEEVSFDAPETAAALAGGGEGGGGGGPAQAPRAKVVVDEALVRARLGPLLERQDLSRFVL